MKFSRPPVPTHLLAWADMGGRSSSGGFSAASEAVSAPPPRVPIHERPGVGYRRAIDAYSKELAKLQRDTFMSGMTDANLAKYIQDMSSSRINLLKNNPERRNRRLSMREHLWSSSPDSATKYDQLRRAQIERATRSVAFKSNPKLRAAWKRAERDLDRISSPGASFATATSARAWRKFADRQDRVYARMAKLRAQMSEYTNKAKRRRKK
jgi:hypothetical protein